MTCMPRPEDLPPDVLDAIAGIEAMTGPATPESVACGVVVRTWREALEGHHARLTDAEMAYTNVATTRAVIPYCEGERVAWDSVRGVLCDPDRLVLPDRSASDALGDGWPDVRASLDELIDMIEVYPRPLFVGFAMLLCPHWWGMPGWPDRASAVSGSRRVDRWAGPGKELREALVEDPTALPFDVWEQVVDVLRRVG